MSVNTTMKEMQAIEREAEALKRDYQAQVEALGQVREEELTEVKRQFDQVTQHLVAEEEAQLQARYQAAQADLEATQAAHQALVQQVLADQREQWIEHIMAKVVDNYGR